MRDVWRGSTHARLSTVYRSASFINAAAQRTYDSIPLINNEILKVQLLTIMEELIPVYNQATRIEAFVESTGKSHEQLTYDDIRAMDEIDRDVIADSRWWARDWKTKYDKVKDALRGDSISADDLFHMYFTVDSDLLNTSPEKPTLFPPRSVVSKFAYDQSLKELTALRVLSQNQDVVMYKLRQQEECIVHLVNAIPYDPSDLFYITHNTYSKRFEGDNDNLSLSMEAEDFTRIDDVEWKYIEKNYPYIPEDTQAYFKFRPGNPGAESARVEFKDAARNIASHHIVA